VAGCAASLTVNGFGLVDTVSAAKVFAVNLLRMAAANLNGRKLWIPASPGYLFISWDGLLKDRTVLSHFHVFAKTFCNILVKSYSQCLPIFRMSRNSLQAFVHTAQNSIFTEAPRRNISPFLGLDAP
jgi:hypothetical protein